MTGPITLAVVLLLLLVAGVLMKEILPQLLRFKIRKSNVFSASWWEINDKREIK